MINLCKEFNLKVPEIKEIGDSVELIFYRATTVPDNARLVPDNAGLVPDSAGSSNLSETEEKVFNLINSKTTRKEIQEELTFSERTIRKTLEALKEKGLIEKLGKGPATYYKKNK